MQHTVIAIPSLTLRVTTMLAILLLSGCSKPVPDEPRVDGPSNTAPKERPVTKVTTKPTLPVEQSAELPVRIATNDETQSVTPQVEPQPTPEPKFLGISHPKRSLDLDALRAEGIEVIESKRQPFRLVSNLPKDIRAPLETLADDLLPALEEYFGPLPKSGSKTPFHMTGYVMTDRQLFAKTGIEPAQAREDFHGTQIGPEFWMIDQTQSYYRAHLLLHEMTHVFMRHFPLRGDLLPGWYIEGMAEYFGTHARDRSGKFSFGVLPRDRQQFAGWERIAVIQRDVARRGVRSLNEVTRLQLGDIRDPESYAWSWALCQFLDAHPKYQKRSRELARSLTREIVSDFHERMFAGLDPEIEAEWMQFAANIEFGFDFERASIDFKTGSPLREPRAVTIASDRSWQSTQIEVEADKTYRLEATGQFTLADQPKPWVSEANGVTIRYWQGRPLGQLIGCVRIPGNEQAARSMLELIPLGNSIEFKPEFSGTLYLRLNDSLAELSDNRGSVRVTISP